MERAAWRQGPVQGCWILLILLFLVDPGFSANAMITAQEFIDLKETQVYAIAASAKSNADNCAYQVEHCNEHCSRAACFQTSSDVAVAHCVGVTTNSNCTCKTQLRGDYTRSYVRIPGLDDEHTILNNEIVTAICTQRSLDDLLLNRNYKYIYEADNIYYPFFFGNVEGTLRFFPGTAIEDCTVYDPRVRPWYIAAISVVKDLVVLVDVASSMTKSIGSNGATALGMAINMTMKLLDTLTQSDRVTVTAYNVDWVSTYSVTVDPSTVLNPLYTLKSYFSLLANARNSSGSGLFFWQPPYQDYNFLGEVRSVAYPAISSTGELVGVAAIDIQVSKIDPNIAPEVVRILNTEKVTRPPTISPAQLMTIAAMENASESTSCNASITGTRAIDAVCQLNANDTLVTFSEGLCCLLSGCIEQKHPKSLTWLWIFLGLVVLAIAAVCILWVCWKQPKVPSPLINPSGGYL